MSVATAATFDLGTGQVTVNYAGAPAPSTAKISDIVIRGGDEYFDLIEDGAKVPSASPGFPMNTIKFQVDSWAPSTSYVNFEPNKPAISSFNLKDDTGGLFEIIYTDAGGTSNVLYKSSTITNANHYIDTSEKGHVIIKGDPPAAAEAEMESEPAPLWLKVCLCISYLIYLAGCLYIVSKFLSKKP